MEINKTQNLINSIVSNMRTRADIDSLKPERKSDSVYETLGNFLPPPIQTYGSGFSNIKYNYETDSSGLRQNVSPEGWDYNKTAEANNESLAKNQTTSEKWINGSLKFLGKTGTAVLGGTVGSVGGIVEFMKTGSVASIYDNDINNRLSDLNESMDFKLPNYYTQAEKDKSLVGQMGTANFWADTVLGGLSFTAGAIVSEGLWTLATGGAGVATSLAKLGAKATMKNTLKNVIGKEVLENTVKLSAKPLINTTLGTIGGKAGSLLNTARFAYTSAGYEAGVESLQYMKEMREGFDADFYTKNGRVPTQQERDEFSANLLDGANAVFGFNVALVGASNVATIGKIFDLKRPSLGISDKVNKRLFGIGLDDSGTGVLQATRAQKIAGNVYSITKPMLIEGVWEEGGQGVVSKAFQNFVKSTYDPKYTEGSMELSEAFMDGMEETFTTKEGFKEVLVGMIIGMIGGKASNFISGQGFSELTGAQNLVKAQADFNNSFSGTKVASMLANSRVSSNVNIVENLIYANRAQASTEIEETSGNDLDIQLARQQSITAQLSMAFNLEQFDATVQDTVSALRTINNSDLVSQYGITTQEAQQFKDTLISDYTDLAKNFKKNREFVEYYFGDNIKGLSKTSTVVLKDAVASILTQGEESYKTSKDILASIKTDLASIQGLSTTIDIISNLDSITEEGRKELEGVSSELKTLLSEINNKKAELSQTRVSNNEESAQQLNRLSEEIRNLEQRKAELDAKGNQIINTKKLFSTQFGDGSTYISAEQLADLDSVMENLTSSINSLKLTDPARGRDLESKVEAYKNVSQTFREFALVNKDISEGAVNLNKKKSLIGKLITSSKLNERENEFLETLKNRLEVAQEHQEVIKLLSVAIEDKKKEILTVEKPDITVQAKVGIDALLANNPYLEGRFTQQELQDAFENAEFIERYSELLEKAGDAVLLTDILKGGILTPEETEEFSRLVDLLATLEVAEGFSNEGVTLQDILKQNVQVKQEVPLKEPEVTSDTFVDMLENETSESALENQEDISNTAIGVQISERVGNTFIHNLTLKSFLEGLNYLTLTHTESNGEVRQGLPTEEKGAKLTLNLASGDILNIEVTEKRSLKLSNKEGKTNIELIEGNSNYRRVKYKNGRTHNYSFMYENGQMIDSDFTVSDRMNYEAIYNLTPGEALSFEVDMTDPYNQTLTEAEAEFKVKIYITDGRGNAVGEVKASQLEGKSNSDNFNTLREEAFEVFKRGGGILKYQADVVKVLQGVPNLVISEQGQPEVVNTTVENVEDWGYYRNGKLQLKNTTEGVNTDFVRKMSGEVVVFRRGQQLIAFPIGVGSQPSMKGEFYKELLETTNEGTAKTVITLNEELIKAGIKPQLFFTSPQNQNVYNLDGSLSELAIETIEQLNQSLEKPDILNLEKEQFSEVMESMVDFDDKPIVSPKIRFNLRNMYESRTESLTEEVQEEPNQEQITEEVYKGVRDLLPETVETASEYILGDTFFSDKLLYLAVKEGITFVYQGKEGVLVVDGQRVLFSTETEEFDLGNAFENTIQSLGVVDYNTYFEDQVIPEKYLPNVPKDVRGADFALQALAEEYASKNNIPYQRQTEYVKVDEERATRIAEAYETMKHEPDSPEVKEAYEELIDQTKAQYNTLVEAGYSFYFFDETNDPYNGNPSSAMRDLTENKVMGVFSTEAGFGSSEEINVADNPLLGETGLTWDYKGKPRKVLANDLFRAVHDAFGHGLEGAGFRARGEENAWQAHVKLFYGKAVGAITTETRGQNSWLNFGKFGESNRTASVEDTVFADQKTGLMPEWTWKEGVENPRPETVVAPKAEEPTKPIKVQPRVEVAKTTPTLITDSVFMNDTNSKYFRKSHAYSTVTKTNLPPTITSDALKYESELTEKIGTDVVKSIRLMEYDQLTGKGVISVRHENSKGRNLDTLIYNVTFKQPTGEIEVVNSLGENRTKEILREGVSMDIKETTIEFKVPSYENKTEESIESLWEFTYEDLLQEGDRIYPSNTTLNLRMRKGVIINNDTKLPFSTNKRPDFKQGFTLIRDRNNKTSLSSLNILRMDEELKGKIC